MREAVKRAQELQAEGKKGEAEEILQALRDLYREDAGGQKVLKEQ